MKKIGISLILILEVIPFLYAIYVETMRGLIPISAELEFYFAMGIFFLPPIGMLFGIAGLISLRKDVWREEHSIALTALFLPILFWGVYSLFYMLGLVNPF